MKLDQFQPARPLPSLHSGFECWIPASQNFELCVSAMFLCAVLSPVNDSLIFLKQLPDFESQIQLFGCLCMRPTPVAGAARRRLISGDEHALNKWVTSCSTSQFLSNWLLDSRMIVYLKCFQLEFSLNCWINFQIEILKSIFSYQSMFWTSSTVACFCSASFSSIDCRAPSRFWMLANRRLERYEYKAEPDKAVWT